MSRILVLTLTVLLGALVPVFGCGSSNVCSGTACDCASGDSCSFGSVSGDCNFNCESGSTCTGSCSGNATVNCSGSSCTLSGGDGSRFVCGAGTCNFTCTGTCTAAGGTVTCVSGTKGPAGCS